MGGSGGGAGFGRVLLILLTFGTDHHLLAQVAFLDRALEQLAGDKARRLVRGDRDRLPRAHCGDLLGIVLAYLKGAEAVYLHRIALDQPLHHNVEHVVKDGLGIFLRISLLGQSLDQLLFLQHHV